MILNPTIADDIETLVQFSQKKLWSETDKDVWEAAQRVEAYLATYKPE